MKTSLTRVLAGAMLLSAFAFVPAQESRAASADETLNAKLKKLSFMLGDWDLEESMTAPGMDAMQSKATAECKMEMSRWVSSRYKGNWPGMGEVTGSMLISFDELKSKYVCVWVDSTQGSPMVATGDFVGKTLKLVSADYETPMGKMSFKINFEPVDSKSFKFELIGVVGGKDTTAMNTIYKRKSK